MLLYKKLTFFMLFVFVFISAFLIGYLAGSKGLNSGISKNLKLEIENLTQKTLEQNNQNFLNLAQNQFGNFQALAMKDFESEKKQVKSIIENIEKSLMHHQRFVSEVEKNNLDQLSGLKENLNHLMQTEKELKQTTKSLESALKSNQSSGAFGEMQLQKLIEMAGLKKYIDFDTQAHLTLEEKTLRPDMILNLPHNRALVIDSKTPMSNYLKSVEESNLELKNKHIKNLRFRF
jgi:DNA recombination protein RmuC